MIEHDNRTILVVDDERSILETYEHYLGRSSGKQAFRSSRRKRTSAYRSDRRSSYELLLASSGAEAIDLVSEKLEAGQHVAAGFFDMQMPGGIDGLETIQRLREMDPNILCAVVTAYQDRSIEDINRQFSPGCEDEWDYINKPFTKAEIQQKARNLVSSWNRRRRESAQVTGLEDLVVAMSQMRGATRDTPSALLGLIADNMAHLVGSSGATIVGLTNKLDFEQGTGSLATAEQASAILHRPELKTAAEVAVKTGQVHVFDDVIVVPIPTARAPKVGLLPGAKNVRGSLVKMLRILATNAAAALDNQSLFTELKQANSSLEDHVAIRTAQLKASALALEERTKQLERTLWTIKETEQQLIQQERLAAVGQLAAGVAHEINNPSAYLMSNLEELEATAEMLGARQVGVGDEEIVEAIAEMPELVSESIEGVRRISAIVRELKRFGRTNTAEDKMLRAEELIDRALRIVGNELRHSAVVERDYGTTEPTVANEGRLLQVIVNLLLNATQALDHSRSDNRITVRTRQVENWIEIEVADTGTGIDANRLATIFEPFHTTKREGTGLGLSISRSIVSQHGGELNVTSEVGVGTTFKMKLPKRDGVRAETLPAQAPKAKPEMRRLRILFIDDEEAILNSYRRRLGKRHEVHVANGGEEGLVALANEEQFDMVVCDLMMPGVNGMEVYSEALHAQPRLQERFVFLTGGAFNDVTRNFLEATDVTCLEKPVGTDKLEEVLLDKAA